MLAKSLLNPSHLWTPLKPLNCNMEEEAISSKSHETALGANSNNSPKELKHSLQLHCQSVACSVQSSDRKHDRASASKTSGQESCVARQVLMLQKDTLCLMCKQCSKTGRRPEAAINIKTIIQQVLGGK